MSISRAGLKQIVACDAGTLSTSPTNATAIGLRKEAVLEISSFKEPIDYLHRRVRNMMNFKVECESLQPTIQMLKNMISFLNTGCDLQVITRAQSYGGNGDVYKFVGDDKPGLDFEYMLDANKRSLKSTWEIAMKYAKAKEFIEGASNTTEVNFQDITGEGEDFTKYRPPYFLSFESPKANQIFARGDIKSRSYSIRTEKTKDIWNVSIVDYLIFEFVIVARDAAIAKQIEIMSNSDFRPSIYVREKNHGSYFDCFDFDRDVLALSEVHTNEDNDRTIEMSFYGHIPLYNISWDLGTTSGGETNGDGSKGGAIRIGFATSPQ